jgi:hypothetical protein
MVLLHILCGAYPNRFLNRRISAFVSSGRAKLVEPKQRKRPLSTIVENAQIIAFVQVLLDRREMRTIPFASEV